MKITLLAPKFWQNKNILAYLLWPLSIVYLLIIIIKKLITKKFKSTVPIICIGNATVGGAGKTPVAIAIATLLIKQNVKIAFISKGYQGQEKGPVKVVIDKHTAKEVGDEPLLLAKIAPTYVAKDRLTAIKLAINDNYQLLIMDDGMQNETIFKDLTILVVDSCNSFGNNFILPAGPLREPLKWSINKADFAIIIGNNQLDDVQKYLQSYLTTIKADIKIISNLIPLQECFVAFAGIAKPEKFFLTLKQNQIQVISTQIFPDHHTYSDQDISNLLEIARLHKAKLITTEKDLINIPVSWHSKITRLPIEVEFEEAQLVINKIQQLIKYEEN